MKQFSSEALERYASLIRKYHASLDLMSDAAIDELDAHLAEGVAFGTLIAAMTRPGSTILDLGSGVGIPGIPIAIVNPDRTVVLSERRQRRVAFLRLCLSQLRSTNTVLAAGPVEAQTGIDAAVVVARALGSLSHLYCLSRHLHDEMVVLVTVKAGDTTDELTRLYECVESRPAVVATPPSPLRGRLIAVKLPGRLPCRPSE